MIDSPQSAVAGLNQVGYLPSDRIAQVVYLAFELQKPLLAEGPAGVGKTELAKAVAAFTERPLIRLQCYEGLDESKALYEWNYRKQLLRLQASEGEWDELESDIFGESFLLERPLLAALRAPEPVVLLIDEVDRVEMETEALLLEVLSDFQASIPELGTVTASSVPFVVLTSNNSRELSDALKRRCLYLFIDYPSVERERAILSSKVPDLPSRLAEQIAEAAASIRELSLKKPPSISESLDWARTLLALGIEDAKEAGVEDTLHVLLKYEADIDKAAAVL